MTTIGIVGLGLIGGSLAKAYREADGTVVYGANRDRSVLDFARLSGAIDDVLSPDNIRCCDAILIAVPPEAAIVWLEENAKDIDPKTLVMDCCGTKRRVCEAGFRLAEQYGFEFVGGHPMAGIELWGFRNSRANMFKGACFVAVPRTLDDICLLERVKQIVMPAGFGSVSATTAERHDRLIAFTSQLAHVVSNAYVKSPTAQEHTGFSAGSYQDLTRVAWLNPGMWSGLFLENGDNLLRELDGLIGSLLECRKAIAEGDGETLTRLLDDGRRRKEEVDGE